MAKFPKPLGKKKRRTSKPFGGMEATPRPEARPVKPKVPGSKDRVHRGEQDIDQTAGRRFPREAKYSW